MGNKNDIARAHKIALDLERDGFTIKSGSVVLAMALGILAEGEPKSHRNLRPLIDALTKAAQITFDALRTNREKAQ